jgi:excisionase family DNA binding protein
MMTLSTTVPRLMTVPEFCRQFQIGRANFYNLVGRGEIRITKIGKSTRISQAAADEFLRAHERAA